MFALILCLFSLHHVISGNECPSPEQIPKCNCKVVKTGIRVNCADLGSTYELQNHLKSLKGRKVDELAINEYTASYFPTDLFNDLEIEELVLTAVEVKELSFKKGKRHFQGLEDSLESLTIKRSFLGDRPLLNLQLDHLKKLHNVQLENNNIPEVGNDWFADELENLSILIFENNGIEELGDKAFSKLNNLFLLQISGNHLQSISRSMLPKTALKLWTLDLENNKIRTLPEDIFSGMPSLELIFLKNNLIHQIKYDVFNPIFSKLDILNLEGNPLQCDNEMKWICETRMPRETRGKCATPAKYARLTMEEFCGQQK